MENSRSAKLDAIFGTPLFAVLLAIGCNVLWGSAFPFIKMGYRLFAIETSDTASILCFAGVRFMLGSLLVLAGSLILEGKLPQPPCGKVLGECCALGLWQTTAQYAFYYMAVALLTGAFGGILNSTQSFLGVIFAHFLYGDADRMTPAKTLGCVLGFAGVLIGTIGQPRRRKRLGRVLYAAGHGHFYPVRPVEQVRDEKGGQLCSLLPSTCSWAGWLCC